MSEENHNHNINNNDGDLPTESAIIDEIKKLNLVQSNNNVKNKSTVKTKYEFWDTQPVLKLDEITELNEAIEADKPISEIRTECYSLPSAFYWDDVCLDDEAQLAELYSLLNENYVEDDDNMFRFDYSPLFLKWALQTPGWRPEWYAGIRVCTNKKLVGFISAVPGTVRIYDKSVKMVEINFLCVHKKLRSKRVAPVLIREITRRVNRQGIFQAVYTGGVLLPKPVATCMYWHRSINPKKLIECHFSQLNNKMTMKRTVKLYKLPDLPQTPGFRALTKKDCPRAFALVNDYLSKFKLRAVFATLDDFEHWFMPRPNIVSTFVVEQPDGTISDLCSYYSLPSSVIDNAHHNKLYAAYSFYNVASEQTGWVALMRDALVQAKNEGFDVFNALNVMGNNNFLKELKFGPGDGQLHYYLYNWQCPQMTAGDVALVLQ